MTSKTKVFSLLMVGTFLSSPARAFTQTLSDNSAYFLLPGTETDYTFQNKNLDGSSDYYKINLNLKEKNGITYGADGTESISIKLPDGESQTLYYTISGDVQSVDIINKKDKMDSVSGNFIGKRIENQGSTKTSPEMGKIFGNFINVDNANGAVHNKKAVMGDIDGYFIGNKSYGIYSEGDSSNPGVIAQITGHFINNGNEKESRSGGIYLKGAGTSVATITGDFISNYNGIYNYEGNVDKITGDFINNSYGISNTNHGNVGKIESSFWANQTGVYNKGTNNKIDSITGSFIGNNRGIHNDKDAEIGEVFASFTNNNLETNQTHGAAICNVSKIGTIKGDFIANTVSQGYGGAIYNTGTIEAIINSTFAKNESLQGGAIYSTKDITIQSDAGESLFTQNTADGKSNAIYMNNASDKMILLSLNAVNGGTIVFDDAIAGKNYDISLTGDGTGKVVFDNLVENVSDLTIDNTLLRLGTKSVVSANNMSGNGTIKVDVTFADNNQIKTGVINISDNLTGEYKIIANPVNGGNADYAGASSVFLTAPNDEATFDLARVVGSPYVWGIDKENTESGYSWSLVLADYISKSQNVVPEVIAGMGLHEAAIEQTRSVVRNVRNKVASGREYCPNCGIYSAEWNGQKLRNVWVLAQGETATIDKPVKMDADIWGVEAGFDVQNDVNNTLGVFASYRKGEYDLNGKADKIRSNIGSEIDIDSYLAGLYYRYDKNMNWLFATVYGGVQQADAKTGDGIAKFDTDGIEFGASVEAGHTFALSNDLTLDPSLGLYYTQINFDDAKDNVGKEYSWKDIKHLEAELGAKLEKQIDAAKIYVKPSVIQTVTSGDSVKITGLNKLSTYDDQTLERIELGGRYGFTDALSAYGWVNYTFGSDYDATAFGVGVNYAW